MFNKGSMKETAQSFCGGMTEKDCKKMADRYARMMDPDGQGTEGGETGMRDMLSRCASFMKRCCAPAAEEAAAQTGEAHTE